MKNIRQILFTAVAVIVPAIAFIVAPASAQGPSNCNVSTAAPTYSDGQTRALSCDTSAGLRVNATVNASVTGFAPATVGTPIAVANPAVTGTLPAGAVVVASNVGTTNMAFCRLGATATTSDIPLAPNGGWFAFTVGGATQLTCITASSTTTVNMTGGAGLATGTGGGGGGGGGGVVTNAGTFPVQLTGATNNINNIAGTISLPTGAASAANQATEIASLATIATNTGAAIPAGSATIGAVNSVSQYPVGATPLTASATGTTAATTATLAGAGGKTTFICGYSIRANATAAATVTNTITGVITATLSSIMWIAPLASGLGVDENPFMPCVPASGTNQAIAVVSGAPGAGGTVSVRAWGYQL